MWILHTVSLSRVAVAWMACGALGAQTGPPPGPAKVEPGLEEAVAWKWQITASDPEDWGIPLPGLPEVPRTGHQGPILAPGERPETHEVKAGDSLFVIAERYGMTAAQLQKFNELKSNLIRVGQVLRIPTEAQLRAMNPRPEPKKQLRAKRKPGPTREAPEPVEDPEENSLLENVRLQVFLDRQTFSPGPIDGKPGAFFLKLLTVYQNARPEARESHLLRSRALAAVPEPFTRYTLRPEDFRFILPAKVETTPPPADTSKPKRTQGASKTASVPPPPSFEELLAADFLGYRDPWEFVAERFHCDEAFLRRINPSLKGPLAAGTIFQVPNVIPFEIDKIFDELRQPLLGPRLPFVATVAELSRLEISHAGKLVAVVPLASARPGLRGRGSWTVLDAIPRPRLTTRREPREPPKSQLPPAGSSAGPAITEIPAAVPPPEPAQTLAPGPNNPVGILWLNLAKAGSKEPLPYGLHGTSIPAQMGKLQGIGGLRLTNWDIARIRPLLQPGTALQWRQR